MWPFKKKEITKADFQWFADKKPADACIIGDITGDKAMDIAQEHKIHISDTVTIIRKGYRMWHVWYIENDYNIIIPSPPTQIPPFGPFATKLLQDAGYNFRQPTQRESRQEAKLKRATQIIWQLWGERGKAMIDL